MTLSYVVSLTDLFATRALWVARAIGVLLGVIPFTPLPINIMLGVVAIALSIWLYKIHGCHHRYLDEMMAKCTDTEAGSYEQSCKRHKTKHLVRRCLLAGLFFTSLSYLLILNVMRVLPY
jgi:flagellar biosynthesis component FlhA